MGKIWKGKFWHNKSVPSYAEAIILGVIVSSLDMRSLIVPNSLKDITASNERPIGNSSHHSQSMLLVPQSGNLHQIVP